MMLSLYIHIPFCKNKCDYCDFYSVPLTGDQSLIKKTVDAILLELEIRLSKINYPEIDSIFIGGGTPSVIDQKTNEYFYKRLIPTVKPLLKKRIEFSTEANPESCTDDFMSLISEHGVNRLSLGVQSFSSEAIKYLGRKTALANPDSVLLDLRDKWKNTLSLDIISGINKHYADDINKALKIKPEHISVYQLSVEEGTKLCTDISKGFKDPPDELLQASAIPEVSRILENNDYRRYEISNYARKGFECRHNLNYWNMQTYLGIGPSAVSSIYSGDSKTRIQNISDVSEYIKNINNKNFDSVSTIESISDEDFMFEHYIMGCRLTEGINETIFSSRFGRKSYEMIPETVSKWAEKNLFDSDKMHLNEEGLLFLDSYLSDIQDELKK